MAWFRCTEHSLVIVSLLLRMCIISWNDFVYDVVQTRPQAIFGWLGWIFINLWEEYHFWLMLFSRVPIHWLWKSTRIIEMHRKFKNSILWKPGLEKKDFRVSTGHWESWKLELMHGRKEIIFSIFHKRHCNLSSCMLFATVTTVYGRPYVSCIKSFGLSFTWGCGKPKKWHCNLVHFIHCGWCFLVNVTTT